MRGRQERHTHTEIDRKTDIERESEKNTPAFDQRAAGTERSEAGQARSRRAHQAQ